MLNKSPVICLLGAQLNASNMGVGALTAGTIKCILHNLPDAEIFLLDYDKESFTYNYQFNDRTIPIRLVNIRFSKKFYLKNNIALLILLSFILKLIPSQKLKNKFLSKNYYLNQISRSDIVASIAGGDSFSDIYGLGRFFYITLPQILSLFLGKKLILLPQTLGPFNRKLTKIIARYILKGSKIVYSRDYQSLKENRSFLGLKSNSEKLRFCYDVGFVMDSVRPKIMDLDGLLEKRKDDSCIVGLNVSGLLFMGGYTQNNMFGLKIDYRELVYDIIHLLIQKKNVIVLLVPHNFGFSEHSESDSVICKKIYNELKHQYNDNLFLAQGSYNQHEIKYIIGLCDFFIGSRMHSCIAALSQNIPAVAIAYSKKFLGVMQPIGVESLVADPRILQKKEIFDIVDQAYEERYSISERLMQTMPEVKKTVFKLFYDIERSLNIS